ncbi:MAG TPA: PTS mannose/fructose/sorbose transporter subunit IIB [candidate division WOR-3 bacterium]|uniref:PTS mannose/fructose/sorbose transporter subunit IIB n=1 Tax=candidate division WOR-3 bacterium TaxID=2052148 RepID=A0A9C9ENZ5_UNCW3|nr:PTS mannose/fructose/sorbose transporter subunit IIB [candidate division WOR-3 bacterium]
MFILRVDDRLIHGQVVAGWARPLGIRVLILVSDRVCKDEWTCNAYKLAIPEGIDFFCVGINKSIAVINKQNNKNIMVIVESVREAYDLLKKGLKVKEVNIGGLGYREGTREIAPYIYLSPEDIDAVVGLFQMGVRVIGKQLPNSSTIDVVKTLTGVK